MATKTSPRFIAAPWLAALLVLSSAASGQDHWQTEFESLRRIVADQQRVIERQDRQLADQQQQLGEHGRLLRLPQVEPQPLGAPTFAAHRMAAGDGNGKRKCPTHYVGYDNAFFIRPYCPDDHPFEMKVNGRIQFRHTIFDPQTATFFDRASGMFNPIDPRNDFEVERGRLTFSGFVHDPKLQYWINMDLDTDDRHRAVAQDFWFNYEFSDAVNLYVGKAFIPGSRSWVDGALQMQFGDRSMATTFFRPDRTIGLWSIGNLTDDLRYRVMLGNGFQTADIIPAQIDDRFLVSGSTWWEPLAALGGGASDLQYHEELAIRLGTCFTFASNEGDASGAPLGEQNFVRLSDGVRLVDPGALAAGVTVNRFDIYLWAADVAAKYRGWSLNAEFYARWLDNLRGTGAIPFNEIYTDGFVVDSGYMLCRDKLEVAGRMSTVDGMFGDAWEYAGVVNVFFNGHNNKLTLDVTYIDGSPVGNTGTNYRVGDRGVMSRAAWQVAF